MIMAMRNLFMTTQMALGLAANWLASNLSSSIFYAFPEVGARAGILGNFAYSFGCIVPLVVFAWLGPILRKKCPEGFLLTTFIRERFGRINQIYISLMSMAYMFCYMVSELSAIDGILTLLTGIDFHHVPIILITITTTLYTAYGGFRASLLTDKVQGWAILVLLVISTIGFGVTVKIDPGVVSSSPLLKSNTLGWELFYIMPIAGYWQRAFSSKNDRELAYSALYGSIMLFPTLFLIGFTGIIAAWAGTYPGPDPNNPIGPDMSFFSLYTLLPDWVQGFVVVLSVCLSCSAYDTLQSAMVSTMSNDLFNNKLPLIFVRGLLVVINVPAVILGINNLDVLIVFLIGDLIAAAVMPSILLGLVDSLYFLNGFDSLVGGLGGFFSIFIFGSAYFNSAYEGALLYILSNGLYVDDYSVLGAFLVAPIGSVVFTFLAFGVRLLGMFILAKIQGKEFEFPKRPEPDTTEGESEKTANNFTTEDESEKTENIVVKPDTTEDSYNMAEV
ncbi:1797_t:CDS:2 [Dentiscutata erythropus]|uniref:1797_t:CDS:1 n=1 Tax=Dentiscutata erythropus TaxID=1348616 RepID=A0A9N8VIY3_9GLOM|nr:1797_t:CDS:2 [Dentiscutata erythropus]